MQSRRIGAAIALGLALLCGAAARVSLARLGHNWDMDSWQIAADLVAHGDSVYASTPRYNYGPPWFLVLGGLRWLQQHTATTLHVSGTESFHFYVAGFLALVDVAIAVLLARRACVVAALLFTFFPVGVFITGFHSQFDNLAILFGLISWMILRPKDAPGPPSWMRVILSAAVLGLSLSTKHLLAFFPLWLLMAPSVVPRGRAAMFAAVAYGVFFASFVPFARAPNAAEGIARHLFQYRSQVSDSALMVRVVDLAVPWNLLERPLKLSGLPLPGGLLLLFATAMLITGRLVARHRPDDLFWYYPAALLVFSIAWAEQYLAIPLVTCAVFRASRAVWVYILVATCVLLMSPNYAGLFGGQQVLTDLLGHRRLQCYHAAFWLVPVLLKDWLPGAYQRTIRPAIVATWQQLMYPRN